MSPETRYVLDRAGAAIVWAAKRLTRFSGWLLDRAEQIHALEHDRDRG